MSKSFDEIRVFCIAQTKVNNSAVRAWLDDLGADEFDLNDYCNLDDPSLLVALAAKQCYMAFQPSLNPNLTKVRKDMVDYLDNILKSGHGSVLEHAVFTFGINGCSRVFTGENNRHRAGVAISERSMRYVRYENIEFWMPECFRDAEGDSKETGMKKARSRGILIEQFDHQEEAMADFAEVWAEELASTDFHTKKVLTSAFRRIIGMGIATGGVWSLNLRALRHTIALRTSEGAEEEIVHVYKKIGAIMIAEVPALFGDFKLVDGSLRPEYWKV